MINIPLMVLCVCPNLRARYFVNDNIAARVTLGMSSSSETINVYEAGGSGTGTIDMGDMSWLDQVLNTIYQEQINYLHFSLQEFHSEA